jgi:hypothetical protein
MSHTLYPEGKGGSKPAYNKTTGILEFINISGEIIYAVDAVNKLVYGGGVVNFVKKRFTVAQVNSGATILAAIPGYKYRMIDCSMAAEGGNAATATSVEVSATQATSGVDLVSNTVGILTDDALVRMGITNSTLLANGAWADANDANTAITISKTGSSLATATHINVYMTYVVEPA